MKCADALDVLNVWDLERDTPLPGDLRGHLSMCAECNTHHSTLIAEQRAYTAYNETIAPTRDLWHLIEARVQPKPSRLSWLRLPGFMPVPAFAAAVIAVMMLAGSLMWFPSERSANEADVASVDTERAPVVVPTVELPEPKLTDTTAVDQPIRISYIPRSTTRTKRRSEPKIANAAPVMDKTEAVVLDIEEKYTAAIASLSRELARQRGSISRSAISQYESDLPQIDAEIRTSRRAVRDQRYDPAAILSLNEAYDRKIDLLRNVVGK